MSKNNPSPYQKLTNLLFLMLLLISVGLLPVAHADDEKQTINLSVASSMTDVLKEIITKFSALHPTVKLQPNFAGSGSLAKQIEQGAPADIYISANPRWMQYLIEKEKIDIGSQRIFAHNRLVFIGEKKSAKLKIEDLVYLKRIALGHPRNVPAGQYAKQAMEKVGIYQALKKAHKLVLAKDVRQALIYAERGEVAGAFVYQTETKLATHSNILFTVDDSLHDRIDYPLALTVTGSKKILARAFFHYMNSAEAITLLKKYGFEVSLAVSPTKGSQ